MGKTIKKLIFTLVFLAVGAFSFEVRADSADRTDSGKRIRVGCVDIDNFLVFSEEGYTTGYAADYLDKIAEYTDWEYEFVRGSWAECIQWLEEGEIDLLLPAEYSEERAERFLFSNEMCCMDYAALIGRKEDDIYYEDYQAFDGMRVGMIAENYLNRIFDLYAERHGFAVEEVFYSTGSELNAALENGEVEAIISGNMNFYENQKLLARVDFMPAYFIASKENLELMEELNEAQNSITLENPYYTATLHEKHYGRIERQAVGFTREEMEYMQEVGVITVRYPQNNYPLYYLDEKTGEAAGIYAEIIQQIFEGCGLEYESVPWTEEEEDWVQAVADSPGTVFCVTESLKSREKDKLNFTDGFFTATYNLVGRRGANLDLQTPLRLAVITLNKGERREAEQRYPHWEIVPAGSVEECLEYVRKGTADLAFVNSIVREEKSSGQIDAELVNIGADIISVDICIAMSDENEILLKTILNKGIKKLDAETVEQSVFNYIVMLEPRLTFWGLVRAYPAYAMVIAAGICLVFVVLSAVGMRYVVSRKKNRILREKNKELNEAIRIQRELQLECEMDPLTGLKNKRVVRELCETMLAEEGRPAYALLVLDIDNFKNVNDEYGHLTGDRVLTELAQCMKEVFTEQILGRIGGDEFLVLVRGVEDGEELKAIMKRFFQRLKKIELPTGVTCSVGAVVSQNPGDSFQDLFEKADKALYDAKRKGKNQYVIESI